MHHPHFLPARFFEFLHLVEDAGAVLHAIRYRNESTELAAQEMHEEMCDRRNELGIVSHPDYAVMFARMQSIYDALAVFLDEAAGLTPATTEAIAA